MDSPKTIVHENDVDWIELSHGDRFGYRRKLLGLAAGARKLGCGLFEVPPGKRAFPFHYHLANEEALYILEGAGTLRLGKEEHAVGAGHFMIFQTGSESAHQLINTGTAPLRYLCISTMISPEVAGYPDSKKLGIIAGHVTGAPPSASAVRKYFAEDSDLNYYEGEE
jgi:uncharacterized cupin superfamily protein